MIRNNRKDGWIEVEHFGGPADGQKRFLDPGWRKTIARYPDRPGRMLCPVPEKVKLYIWDRAEFCEYEVVDIVLPDASGDCLRIAIAEGTSRGVAREQALKAYRNPQSSR